MSIIRALILLFIWGKNELLMAVGDPLRNDPRFEKLAASPAPRATDKQGEVSARKRPYRATESGLIAHLGHHQLTP